MILGSAFLGHMKANVASFLYLLGSPQEETAVGYWRARREAWWWMLVYVGKLRSVKCNVNLFLTQFGAGTFFFFFFGFLFVTSFSSLFIIIFFNFYFL